MLPIIFIKAITAQDLRRNKLLLLLLPKRESENNKYTTGPTVDVPVLDPLAVLHRDNSVSKNQQVQ